MHCETDLKLRVKNDAGSTVDCASSSTCVTCAIALLAAGSDEVLHACASFMSSTHASQLRALELHQATSFCSLHNRSEKQATCPHAAAASTPPCLVRGRANTSEARAYVYLSHPSYLLGTVSRGHMEKRKLNGSMRAAPGGHHR